MPNRTGRVHAENAKRSGSGRRLREKECEERSRLRQVYSELFTAELAVGDELKKMPKNSREYQETLHRLQELQRKSGDAFHSYWQHSRAHRCLPTA